MTCVELQARHYTMLNLILAATNERSSLASVVSDLITGLVYGVKGNNAKKPGARQIRGGGIARIFLRRGVCFSKCQRIANRDCELLEILFFQYCQKS